MCNWNRNIGIEDFIESLHVKSTSGTSGRDQIAAAGIKK